MRLDSLFTTVVMRIDVTSVSQCSPRHELEPTAVLKVSTSVCTLVMAELENDEVLALEEVLVTKVEALSVGTVLVSVVSVDTVALELEEPAF